MDNSQEESAFSDLWAASKGKEYHWHKAMLVFRDGRVAYIQLPSIRSLTHFSEGADLKFRLIAVV